jgi:nucleoside phosphorylase
MTATGPALGPRPYAPPEWQIRNSTTLDQFSPTWKDMVRKDVRTHIQAEDWPRSEDLDNGWPIEVRRGYVLAGGTLLEDGSLPQMATTFHDRTLAAEMEGAGFAAACVEKRLPWLVIRGVADFGEPGRLKHWQFPATFAAARYLREALVHGRLNFTTLPG